MDFLGSLVTVGTATLASLDDVIGQSGVLSA
jgi:hypothetical protein